MAASQRLRLGPFLKNSSGGLEDDLVDDRVVQTGAGGSPEHDASDIDWVGEDGQDDRASKGKPILGEMPLGI